MSSVKETVSLIVSARYVTEPVQTFSSGNLSPLSRQWNDPVSLVIEIVQLILSV